MGRPLTALATAATAVATVAAMLAMSGCGATGDATPVACLEGPDAYLAALAEAPGEVRLGGEVPISECLAENQRGGDLATVGGSIVEAATTLNAEAREGAGAAALKLGYLLGAAARGAEETEGIHADLLRRLEVAARYAPGNGDRPSVAFRRSYEDGYQAGLERG